MPSAAASTTESIRHRREWLASTGSGLLSAAFLSVAFPPVGLWPAAFAVPLPLMLLAVRLSRETGKRLWPSALLAGLGTVPGWLYLHWFMADVTTLGYPLLALYLGVWQSAFVWLLAVNVRRSLRSSSRPLAMVVGTAPLLWVTIEFLRGDLVLGGYPWFFIAHPTADLWTGALGNPGAALGVYFVSFVVALPAAGICEWRLGNRAVAVWLTASLSGTCLLLGIVAPSGRDESDGLSLRAGVVQTNVPQSNKMSGGLEQRVRDHRRSLELTRLAAAPSGPEGRRPDVVLWPETMFSGMVLNPEAIEVERKAGLYWTLGGGNGGSGTRLMSTDFCDELVSLQRDIGVPMLVGGIAADGLRIRTEHNRIVPEMDARYNSVLLIKDGRIEPTRYDKMELTPFGEMIPIAWRFPQVQQAIVALGAKGMSFDLAWGRHLTVFTLPAAGHEGRPAHAVRLVTPICFEATFGRQCRKLVYDGAARRADVMVNVSNDGWFGDSHVGRPVHLLVCRWRCLELGVPMVRSVNTGISAVIDSRGRVLRDTPDGSGAAQWNDGVLVADVPLPAAEVATWFGSVGDLFAWLALGGSAFASALTWNAARRVGRPALPRP